MKDNERAEPGDLSLLYIKSDDGRSMVQASWQDDGTVGLFIYARNQAEDDTWTGCATYAVKSAKMDKIAHLPYQGFDWIGNLKVTEANSHIDLQ